MTKRFRLLCGLLLLSPFLIAQNFPGLSLPGTGGRESLLASVAWEKETVTSGEDTLVYVTVEIPEKFHQTLQPEYFFFELQAVDGFTLGEVLYPDTVEKDGVAAYYEEVVLTSVLMTDSSLTAGEYALDFRLHYQLCDENGTCLFPETLDLPASLNLAASAPVKTGILTIIRNILLAFIGGILLNVMPCVLPVLSIKALNIVNQSGSRKKEIFRSSFAYAAGIIASLLVLAGVVIVLKVSGESVGWGFQFQNPVFVIVLEAIIFIFALSLFDLYTINPMATGMAAKAASRSGHLGSFLSGIFAVMLATPCTAPFMGAALGFAFTQPPAVIIAIFSSLGLGLAFPFILLGIRPGLIRRLPKPGAWMELFKQIMGFLLLGTAVYLLDSLSWMVGRQLFMRTIMFQLALVLTAWILGRLARPGNTRRRYRFGYILAILVLTASSLLLFTGISPENVAAAESSAEQSDGYAAYVKPGWEVWTPERQRRYIEEGHPVFISFTARWCTTCRVNDTLVLSTEEVKERFREKGVKLLSADYTNNDAEVGAAIAEYGKAGVPLYVFFPPGESLPAVLPELISKSMVLEILETF